MQNKIGSAFIIAVNLLNPFICSAFGLESEPNVPIYNRTKEDVSKKDVEKAYLRTLERYRRVLPVEMRNKIDPKLIDGIYIVEQTSNPDVSEAGFTKAVIDAETGEVESIMIEVKPGYRKGFRSMSFEYLLEHEFGHALAFLAGIPQAQQIGHSLRIEDLMLGSGRGGSPMFRNSFNSSTAFLPRP